MAGRPTKKTPTREEVILDAIRQGNTRKTAAALSGVSERTLYEWAETNPQFLQALEKADAEAESRMVSRIEGATEDNWTAAAWWLERRRNESWGKKDKLDLNVRDIDAAIERELATVAGRGEAPLAGAAPNGKGH